MSLGPAPRFWDGECGFSALRVDAVPGNGFGIKFQSYVEFFQGRKMIAECLYKNLVLFI